ncbi:golgi-body localization protein domain-containing protein [Trametes polyzona]|nr:golgi-body localization protein domain-containing protein [Trametes polyzona]
MHYFLGWNIILHALLLRPMQDLSLGAALLIWAVRILTLSLLFRTYIGPAIVRLVSRRLRIRSVSLRSIRGIYFKAGSGTWRVERVGISYHKPSPGKASRFSIKVEGLSLELDGHSEGHSRKGSTTEKTQKAAVPNPSHLVPRVLWLLLSTIYSILEPYCRPAVRSFFVSLLRLGIRALPAITHVVDFELDSASVTHASLPGVKFSVGEAKLHTRVSLAYVPSVVSVPNDKSPHVGHRRFASVADWNARVKGSVRRTWDRAWGATQVAASVNLQVKSVVGYIGQTSDLFAGSHRGHYFLDLPAIQLRVAARLNPHQGVERGSVETSLDFGTVNMQVDVIQKLLKKVKESRLAKERAAAAVAAMNGSRARHSKASPSISPAWKSPASPLMGALSASMRWKWAARQSQDLKVKPRSAAKRVAYASYIKALEVKVARCTTSYQPEETPGDAPAVLLASVNDIRLAAGLSNPDRDEMHKHWLGSGSRTSNAEPTMDSYTIQLSANQLALDRNGVGELMDHMRLVTLDTFRWDSLVSRWPSPWLQGSKFLAGDPNAQLLVSHVSFGTLEVTERLDMLEKYATRQPSVEKTVHGRPLLPPILAPVPRISLGFGIGEISLRLISPTREGEQEPFVLEARTDGICGSATSQFSSRPDRTFGDMVRDCTGLNMEFAYGLEISRSFAKIWFGPDAHMRGAHPQSYHAASYPNETLLQLDSIQLSGSGHGLGELVDEASGVVALDVPSIFTQCQVSTEAFSVELWQPEVIKALACIMSRTSKPPAEKKPVPSRRLLDRLPFGLSVSLSIGRLMLFMTSPDLAPDDTLNISRGLAVRTGVSFSYSALRPIRRSRLAPIVWRGQQRIRLALPAEQVMRAAEDASSTDADLVRAMVQLSLWDTVLRDAFSTPFAADDPYGTSESSAHHRSLEFLHVAKVETDVTISGSRPNGMPTSNDLDSCEVTVTIPTIKAVMHLSQIYNALLAVHTIQTLLPPRPSAVPTRATPPPTMTFDIRCHLQRLQLRWGFPLSSKMFLRVSSAWCHIAPSRTISVGWDHILVAVSVPVSRDGEEHQEWEELVRLPRWRIEVIPETTPLTVKVKGDSGRLRIPFDFILADLILDINLTLKSVKHLVRMVAAGEYQDPPSPPAEDAKHVPNIKIDLGRLIVEAADDELEARLGLIWRTGFDAARLRIEREDAFQAKVETIISPKPSTASAASRATDSDFQFTPKHTVSVADARQRLNQIHSAAWVSAFRKAHAFQIERQESFAHAHEGSLRITDDGEGDMVRVNRVKPVPPLLRLAFQGLSLSITPPSFPYDALPQYLHQTGDGLPLDTTFSLLIPLHIHFKTTSVRLVFREYPLPLLHVPPHSKGIIPALEFDSDVVIAEEMGSDRAVEWVKCEIVKEDSGLYGAAPLSVRIPKTIMPVKSYARPTIRVMTDGVTDFSWGVSYGAATQDFMRIVDTLSHAPRDSSPAVGFWDKLRLVFHWRVKVDFVNEVHLHMKGSRDPYELRGYGAGFALCWKGHPSLHVGQPNDAGELIQVKSDTMLVIVPNIEDSYGDGITKAAPTGAIRRKAQTICAKFRSGVCFGVGFALERACGPECERCSGKPFDRQCRLFNFRPHYDVKLEWKDTVPEVKSPGDSYNGFRSDFIHMSISLTSGLDKSSQLRPSNFHLSPEVFSHFWSWWSLFNGALSLPIRQGKLYPRKRPISPKFGQHLATLKYMFSVPQIFVSHVYVDNSQEAWADGVTPFVGVKALIDEFHADMHQRDTETTEKIQGGTKTIHHKPFYAIEVVLKGLDLRALLAVFPDPLKQCTPLDNSPLVSNYRTRNDLTPIDLNSNWVDMDDFAIFEQDSPSQPDIYVLPAVSCPRFTYFKKVDEHGSDGPDKPTDRTKFGSEDTHVCLLGKEPSVNKIQMELASARVEHLRQKAEEDKIKSQWQRTREASESSTQEEENQARTVNDRIRMIKLLEGYIAQLRQVDMASQATTRHGSSSYYMPADMVSPDEWAGFDNVYQIHSPHIILDNAIRDIMMQYYYCSRSRRGIEYHMATRAVKFIRDQAQVALTEFQHEAGKHKGPAASAQAAAIAVKKLLVGEGGASPSVDFVPQTVSKLPSNVDPLHGWAEGVSPRKGHFCLLLKPQVVLRSDGDTESVCVLAAVQGKLKTFSIMDDANAHDPISGKIMNRNFAWLTGLQTFSPSATNTSGKDYVPLEVLIDLRADNSDFDRLVPQTDATFQYDKFNRLRLRNDVTSVAKTSQHMHAHLQNQTDLIRLHVPRFTVSANDRHFQAISNIVTKLVLFSDAAHKTRAEKLENLLFSYDFTNLSSAADVVANMQQRLRQALETKREAEQKLRGLGNPGRLEELKIEAHILLLVEELNLIFDAIKLAQDKASDMSDQKSALLLHASSEELSWRMLDRHDQLLAKLAVRDTDFYWLSRHDSSTVNKLSVGDLQAFDGAADAEWTEILSKYDEPSTHPLVKRKLFLLADWTVLPPVGGITIYEEFELMLHPMRLQIDIRVGRKIMEYLWPARRARNETPTETESFAIPEAFTKPDELPAVTYTDSPRHASFDLPARKSLDTNRLAPPMLRRLGTSRSFTDLRNSARQDSLQVPPRLQRTRSSDALKARSTDALAMTKPSTSSGGKSAHEKDRLKQQTDDAAEMKTRASQKTFVRVKVASLHLLLSIAKEDSFLCRDARIRTRDLEYRNQTWSFEELVDQFIPSGRNWRGWVKVAFQQPLVPVLPVARELITKTKWIASKKDSGHDRPTRPSTPKVLQSRSGASRSTTLITDDVAPRKSKDYAPRPKLPHTLSDPPFLTTEPETIRAPKAQKPGVRKRAISLFKRKHAHSQDSIDSSDTTTSVSQHILSTTRQVPQVDNSAPPPETPGPSQLCDIQENSRPQSFQRNRSHSYTIHGQQAELRVPVDDDQDRVSSISLALEQLDREGGLDDHHPDDIVEHLDVIDPQISTVSTLTNAANAIVVPPLSFYSRKPVIVLPRLRKKKTKKQYDPEKGDQHEEEPEYEDALDQHVEDVLRKRDKFRRVMQGVWSFVKTREFLFIVTAIYGFLVVFWGTGIVFFLAKFINLHNDITQGFWVELCQQVETGLFTATSIGFIPFRIMDTYRICKIWHYKRKIAKLRAKAGLPELYDPDDLPDPVYDPNYIHVLTEEEQIDLHYQQHKFMDSQTWYRPHGTQTHRAFPIDLALWICVCNDLNSFFQCLLSGTMWGLDRFQRPAWTTGTTLPAAFVAGIVAGVLIYWGGRKTRRTEQVEERLRMALKMEREPQPEAPTESVPAIHIEEANECPEHLPPATSAPTAETSTETATMTDADEKQTAEAEVSEHGAGVVVERDDETGLKAETRRPPTERRLSGRSLKFADEMVVPPAEHLSPAQ